MKPQGGLSFSTPVGEDVERRQGGGMFPDYSWVPVGALRKTRLIGSFPRSENLGIEPKMTTCDYRQRCA